MEYYWELRSKNAQNSKALMCPLQKQQTFLFIVRRRGLGLGRVSESFLSSQSRVRVTSPSSQSRVRVF